MIIRSKNKAPQMIYCARSHIKHLPTELKDVFILVNTAEFQSVSQAALYLETRFPAEKRDRELIQLILLVKEIQLSTDPHLMQLLRKLAADGIGWYIAETCGLGPLPPREIDLDIFRNTFMKKPFKSIVGIQQNHRKRTKVGL